MDSKTENRSGMNRLTHEMTPLDVAISQFEKQANAYYSKKRLAPPETPEGRLQREKELASALEHLKTERRKVAVLAQIQVRLAEYQGWGRQKASENPFELLEEKHQDR